jgi:hypothetical protein
MLNISGGLVLKNGLTKKSSPRTRAQAVGPIMSLSAAVEVYIPSKISIIKPLKTQQLRLVRVLND